ncbi:hypothetical protein AB0M46_23055 [Dactylosporangium sp. NPDC051485]|uniref:hypothetical protein n=1 Tax=Dactylosporangium sp. NPDC051485 TaxID=3154846 RepID=UPI003430235A
MAELGLVARAKRRRRGLTRQGKRPATPDLIKRKFTAPAPDVAWRGDMTEIVTDEGKHRHSVCDRLSPIDYERSTAWPLEAQVA